MANDREVLRIVWEGQIPVCFQVDPDEIDGVQQPENFYLMISRLSYLPLVTDKVKMHFHCNFFYIVLILLYCSYFRYENISLALYRMSIKTVRCGMIAMELR